MRQALFSCACFAALLFVHRAAADTALTSPFSDASPVCSSAAGVVSCTGSFTNGGMPTPEDVFTYTFTAQASETITIQTYGFGGGTNAAGTVIPTGGFDPLVALFSGTPTGATLLTDNSGNPVASADNLINTGTGLPLFSPGCGPNGAGMVTIGSGASAQTICGDSELTATLPSTGTYTLLLTDSNFLPVSVDPGIAGAVDLTDTVDNYFDLSGGVFQTCDTNGDCINDTAEFAVDISSTGVAAVPEPGSLPLLVIIVVSLALASSRKTSRKQRSCAGSVCGRT